MCHRALAVALLLASFTCARPACAADPSAVDQGVRLFRDGHYDEARAALTPAAEAKPPDSTAILYLGRIALAKGDAKEAARWFEKAVGIDGQSSEAHLWLGRAYGTEAQSAGMLSQLSLAHKTKAEFDHAVALDPNNLDARDGLITYYLSAPGFAGGSADKARQQAAEIQSRDPLRGALAFGRIAEDQKDPAGAERAYRSAAAAFPDSMSARIALGLFLTRVERYDEAFAVFDSILAARPDEPNALYQIGRAGALSGKQLDRAERSLKKYLDAPPPPNAPGPAAAHWRLGMVYEKQGKKDAAADEYRKALAINPDFADAKKSLAKLK